MAHTPYNQYRYGDGLTYEETRTIQGILFMFVNRIEKGETVNWRQIKKIVNKEIKWRRSKTYQFPCGCGVSSSCFICRRVFLKTRL